MKRFARLKVLAGLLLLLASLAACSELTVFVPPPRYSDLKSILALNEEGDLAIAWGATKTQKVSAYLIELPAEGHSYEFTEAAETSAPLTFEKVKVEKANSPFVLGERIESVNDIGMLVKGRLVEGKKYLLQVIEDRTVPKMNVDVHLLQVSFDTTVASSASSIDGSITLSWNAVIGANRYRVYADETMTDLLGESSINELVVTPLPGQRYKEFFVQPLRGNLVSKSVIHIGVNDSETRVVRITAQSPDGLYTSDDVLDFLVEFSLPVNVFGDAGLPLIMDGTKRRADYISGTGTKEIFFRYRVQVGDDTDKIANDGTLSGEFIDTFDLRVAGILPSSASPQNLLATASLSIDTTPPSAPRSIGFNTASSGTGDITASWQLGTDKHYSTDAIKLCSDADCSLSCGSETATTSPSKAFTGLGEGVYYACVQSRDLAGLNSPWVSGLLSSTVDKTGPLVARVYSISQDGHYKESQDLTLAVEFNEPVVVSGDSDIKLHLETGTVDRQASYLSGSGSSTLTFRYTVMAGDNAQDLEILSPGALDLGSLGTLEDNLGNPATTALPAPMSLQSLAGQSDITIDTTRPASPSLVSGGSSFSTSTQLSVSWTDSTDANFKTHQAMLCTVNTCDSGCLTINANASSPVLLSGANGSQYYACVRGEDQAGNLSFWIPSATATTIDATPPSITTVSSSKPNGIHDVGETIDITVQFTEVVSLAGSGDLSLALDTGLTDREAAYLSGDGSDTLVFRYTVQAGDNTTALNYRATDSLLLGAAGEIRDAAGNPAVITLPALANIQSLAGQKALGIDTTAPSDPASVTFDETLVNQLRLDFSWTASTDIHFDHYNVKLCQAPNCATGCLAEDEASQSPFSLDGVNGQTYYACVQAEDSVGHLSSWIASTNPAAIDTTAPVIAHVDSLESDGYFVTDDTVDIQVTFSKDVTVSDGPNVSLQLSTLPVPRNAVYLSGSGSSTLTFRYVVQAGDAHSDLEYASLNALVLGGSSRIRDTASNDAAIILPALGSANSLGGQKAIIIDTTAPSIPGIPTFAGALSNSTSFDVSWTESTDTHIDTHSVKLCPTADCTSTCSPTSSSATSPLTFSGTEGESYYACVQSRDLAGLTSAWVPSAGTVTVDSISPTVTEVDSSTADAAYKEGEAISIQVKFSKAVYLTNEGDIALELDSGLTNRSASYSSGHGTDTLTFTYTVGAGDVSSDLNYRSTAALLLGGSGQIKDLAGSDAVRTLPALVDPLSLAGQKSIVIDTDAPLAPVIASPADGHYATANVTSVSGTSEANATITVKEGGTTVGTATADGSGNWTSTLSTPLTIGSYSLTATATDAATNTSGASAANDLTVDTTAPAAPVITSSGATTNDNTPTVSGTAEANTTVKVYIDGTTEVASVTSNGSGAWTATLSTLIDDTHNVTAKAIDPGLRESGASNAISFLIDTEAPTVVSVSASTANGTYPKDSVIHPTITFSEDVSYTVSPTLTLETGTSDAVAAYSSGDGTSTITLAFTVASGHSSVDLDYVANNSLSGTLSDAAGNNAVLTLPAPGAEDSLGDNKSLVIDGVVPTITTVSSDLANGVYPATSDIDIKITFSRSVSVNGTPILALNTSPAKSASYLSGTGSTVLVFRYTVAGTDTSADLEYTATTALTLAGGTIEDTAGNDAILTLPALATANSLGGSKNIEIAGNTQAPSLSANASSTDAYVGTAITPVNVNNSTGNDQTNDSRTIIYSCLYDESVNGAMDSGGTSCASLSGASFDTGTGVLSWTPTSTNQPAYNTAKDFEFRVTGTSPANLSGSVSFTTRVIRPWTSTIGFDAGTAAQYTFDNALIDHSGGKVSLIAKDQIDDALETDWNVATNYGAGKFNSPLWMVKNGAIGACHGHLYNCDSGSSGNWLPQLASRVLQTGFETAVNQHLSHPSPGAADYPTHAWSHKKGYVYSAFFDGGDYLTSSRVIEDDFTVNVWIKTAQSEAYGDCDEFFEGWGIISLETPGPVHDWAVTHCDGYILAGTGGAAEVTLKSTMRVNDFAWHMVTFTRQKSSGEMKLYIDGILQGTTTNSSVTLDAGPTIYFGRNPHESNGYFGYMDEPILWNKVLTATEIEHVYVRQDTRNSGQFVGRAMDSGYAGAPWTSMAVALNSPVGKELPDNASSETAAHYPNVPANLMNGNVALLHMNETAGNYMDTSGGGNHGGSPPPSRNNPGRFGKAPYLVTNNHLNLGSNAVLSFGANSFSSSIWFRTNKVWDAGTKARLFSNGYGGIESGWTSFIYEKYAGFGIGCTGGSAAGCTSFRGSTVVSDNKWHHLVTVADRSTNRVRIYLDGVQETPTILAQGTCGSITGKDIDISSCPNLLANRTISFHYLGIHDNFSDKYQGFLDEFAAWNRPLSATEAKHLYLRGALRLQMQVRACTNASCSDSPSWKGPDGTNQTYFTELNNKTSPATQSGTVNTGRLTINFADYGLNLSGRYFQYRFGLESDDANTLCNYGSAESCSPEIIGVTAGPNHYPIAPSIVYNTPISFYTFNTLSETLGAANCSGNGIRYQLSLNATNWYYHNGTTWVSSNGSFAQASPLAQMNSYGLDFSTMVGRNNLYIRAMLGSSGTTPCELDALSLGGNSTY